MTSSALRRPMSSSLGVSLLRKSMLGSAPLPVVVHHPSHHAAAHHKDLSAVVTNHFFGRVVRGRPDKLTGIHFRPSPDGSYH